MTHREPRPDLGLEITLFYLRDRNGAGRLTVRTKDVFGTPLELAPETFAAMLEATARDVRAHVQKAAPDIYGPWVRFDALEAETVEEARDRAMYGGPRWIQAEQDVRTIADARAAFEASDPAHVYLKRGPEGEFARTPNEFVDLWRKGYR